MDVTETLRLLREAIFNVQASRYTSAASATIICYDALLTLPAEVAYVWYRKISLGSVLYYTNKYVSLVSLLITTSYIAGFDGPHTNQYCGAVILLTAITQIVAAASASWLLTLRVLALLGNSRWAAPILYTLLTLAYLGQTGLLAASLHSTFKLARYEPVPRVCSIQEVIYTATFRYVYLPPIVYESIITALTLWKTISFALKKGINSSLIINLGRDGVIYFVTIVGLRITNSVIFTSLPVTLMNLVLYLLWSLVSVLVSRFFLSLRESGSGTNMIDAFSTEVGTRRAYEMMATKTIGGGSVGGSVAMQRRHGNGSAPPDKSVFSTHKEWHQAV